MHTVHRDLGGEGAKVCFSSEGLERERKKKGREKIETGAGVQAGGGDGRVKPLRSKAVCEMLDISASTLSRMVRRGEIPCVRIGTGKNATVRFFEESIMSWIQRGGCRRHTRDTRALASREPPKQDSNGAQSSALCTKETDNLLNSHRQRQV